MATTCLIMTASPRVPGLRHSTMLRAAAQASTDDRHPPFSVRAVLSCFPHAKVSTSPQAPSWGAGPCPAVPQILATSTPHHPHKVASALHPHVHVLPAGFLIFPEVCFLFHHLPCHRHRTGS